MAQNLAQLPPQALEAEMAVLGSMLIERDAVEKAIESLVEKDFYQDVHRKIFHTIAELNARGSAVDLLIVGEELRKRNQLDEVGGTQYLSEMIHRVGTAAHVEYYGRLVKEKSILRELIHTATAVVTACYAESKEAQAILDEAQANILKVAERQTLHGIVDAKTLAHEVLKQIEDAHTNKEAVTGVPSGLRTLDSLTTGFQKSDLILIAARPSQGKTALALNIASHVALDVKKPVLFFSLEMSKHAIMQRLISSVAVVNLREVRTGFFRREKWTDLTNAAARFSEAPLYVVDTPGLSVLTVRSLSRQLSSKLKHEGKELGLVVIDYLQLMRGASRSENRQQEVSEISRGLKYLARDLDVPVIALSQLSRRTEEKGRVDTRPQLSDLRESGALEQDADLVAFIYRESYYKRNDPSLEGKAEIIVAKQRQGPTGVCNVAFDARITRFGNQTEDQGPSDEAPAFEEAQTSFSE
ncbi:MAG: replicative DNA helicase [Elusimicrobiota bacterium]